jgi:hypothetical protein
VLEPVDDLLVQPGLGQEVAEGRRRGREAARHLDPGRREIRNHLAQRCVLAADLFQVAHA